MHTTDGPDPSQCVFQRDSRGGIARGRYLELQNIGDQLQAVRDLIMDFTS